MMIGEHWQHVPEAHDYPAARSYLSLLVDPEEAKRLVRRLKAQDGVEHFAAKDILRASGLACLPVEDPEVHADLIKVHRGVPLSPALLVRGAPVWIADGYHRICASYHLNPKSMVCCKIVGRS
jgi:hypothetical protein